MAPPPSGPTQKDTASSAAASESPAPAAPAVKAPPPETPTAIRRRSYIVLSFWLLVVFLGLPFWWKTTTIYRADLPLDRMLEWADGKACRPAIPIQIAVHADSLQEEEANHLVRLAQHAIDDLNDFSGHHLRLQLAPRQDRPREGEHNPKSALSIHLKPGDATTAALDPYRAALDITYPLNSVPPLHSASSMLTTYIATELRSTFAEEQSIVSYLLSTSSSPTSKPAGLSPAVVEALEKRATRAVRYAPTYHLTFSLFTDGPAPTTWDIDTAINEYMKPLLDVLRPIHNFTIDTQVQLYATPGVQSQTLTKDDLASFINAAEWPLSPSIGGAPTINFLTFIGNQTIGFPDSEGQTSQSWMIPQWGTVYLLSQPDTNSHVTKDALRQPMLTFGGHLLTLLGTPQSGSLPLRLSSLSRIRSADLLLRASDTLGSLARLSRSLPSIAIPRNVADGVAKSIRHLEEACASLGSSEALYHARIAEEEAERAFFEKSMVGQLYFPDEHKIAVYLPLLGPVTVPLVMGAIKEIKRLLQARKQRAQEAKEKKSQ
ncbi:unnamed protein product [Clonostachys rhizophaga]|uniref:GPI transamidase component PIG-S n=1 Tax=Clonostachys rhizophaga TaxID=160324 RepID=A0A9N9VLG1_9HYPO|nr:unnamed protein product [Clonostachys rhizophaga]